MPWPEKQRRAIFLATQRKKGTAAAKKLMHEAGYGKKPTSKHMHKMPGGHMMSGKSMKSAMAKKAKKRG